MAEAVTPRPASTILLLRDSAVASDEIEVFMMVRHYEINQTPNAVGGETKRWFTFQGPDRMSLRVDPSELTPPAVETTFVWERVVK